MQRHAATALILTACLTQDSGEADWVPVNVVPSGYSELEIDRGVGEPTLVIRSDEELNYVVEMDIGPFKGVSVGEARFRSWLENSADSEIGHIETTFSGDYAGYKLDHQLHTRHLSSEDIALESFDTQRGSESRRRELSVLKRDGVWTAEYRYDGHCSGCEDESHFVKAFLGLGKPAHCKKCKEGKHRVWREPRVRTAPANTLDFLSSIYLIRTLILTESEGLETPLLDKDRLWNLSLTAGEEKDVSVPSGKYACRRIFIGAERPESEPEGGKFSGLFGMKGSMKFWVHETTGVLVQIAGELPLGPFDLGVRIRLKEAKNAPAGLRPLDD